MKQDSEELKQKRKLNSKFGGKFIYTIISPEGVVYEKVYFYHGYFEYFGLVSQ